MHSLVDLGMTTCSGGLDTAPGWQQQCSKMVQVGRAEQASGYLALPLPASPSADSIVAQLDLLLTGGRLRRGHSVILPPRSRLYGESL
jgi:hypothetical protein